MDENNGERESERAPSRRLHRRPHLREPHAPTRVLIQPRPHAALRLRDILDENDDIQNVYANDNIPEEMLQG